jgi:hypothetical protein
MALIKCEECGKEISNKASSCPHCGVPLQNQAESNSNESISVTTTEEASSKFFMMMIVAALFVFAFGMLRIYTGSGIGMKIVTKDSFSFSDTFVNLDDDVFGKPRIFFANEHPAVKKQLEKMGILETDEQIQARVEVEMRIKQDEIMRDIKAQQVKAMHDYEKQMRQLGY